MQSALSRLFEFIKGKKHPLGHVTTRKDGSQWKKISDTGDSTKDWQRVKAGEKKAGSTKKKKKAARVDTGDKFSGAAKYTRGKGDKYKDKIVTQGDLDAMSEMDRKKYLRKDHVWHPIDFDSMAAKVPEGVHKEVWQLFCIGVKLIRDKAASCPPSVEGVKKGYSIYMPLSEKRGGVEGIYSSYDSVSDQSKVDRVWTDLMNGMGEAFAPEAVTAKCLDDLKKVIELKGAPLYRVIPNICGQIPRIAYDAFSAYNKANLQYHIDEKIMLGQLGGVLGSRNKFLNAVLKKAEYVPGGAGYRLKKSEKGEDLSLKGTNIGHAKRAGTDYRKGKQATEQSIIQTFGFRGIEYGNSVTQKERPEYMNKCYDALMDLSRMVGVSPKALSLNGSIGLAFGSRGRARAAAHYEPGQKVINFTRKSGAGALAHEWAHAMDDNLKSTMLNTTRPEFGVSNFYADASSASGLSEAGQASKIPGAFVGIMKAITRQDREEAIKIATAQIQASETYISTQLDHTLKSMKADLDKSVLGVTKSTDDQWHAVKEDIQSAIRDIHPGENDYRRASNEVTGVAIESLKRHLPSGIILTKDYERLKKSVRAANGAKDTVFHNAIQYGLYKLTTAKRTLTSSMNGGEFTRNENQFVATMKKKGAYYASPHEMFARSFEAYIHDKLTANGERSDFLVQTGRYDSSSIYPQGDHRTRINRAIDDFVQAIDRSEKKLPDVIKSEASHIGLLTKDENSENFAKSITVPKNAVHANPSEAQKEAGNYKKHHVRLHGMRITIENPRGSIRKGVSPDGKEWSSRLAHHYGYFKGTVGNDKDHLDCFIGPDTDSHLVHVVNQCRPDTGKFDEHKVMLGFKNKEEAEHGYLQNYEAGWKGLDSMIPMTMDQFKHWMQNASMKEPASHAIMKSNMGLVFAE